MRTNDRAVARSAFAIFKAGHRSTQAPGGALFIYNPLRKHTDEPRPSRRTATK